MNKNYDDWKATSAEFRGYMKSNMEAVHATLREIKEQNVTQNNRIDSLETSRDRMKGGVTLLSVLWLVLTFIISKFWGKG